MRNHSVSRRSFLQRAGTSTLAINVSMNALSANETIALGIIGTGGRGQRLLKAITNIPDFRVAAVCDLISERAASAAEICEQYKPTVKQYTNMYTMLEKEKLDACIVTTEEGNHAKCVVPVLQSGLHCFSEKPMDTTVEKVEWIAKTAREEKGVYQVGFQRRYLPTFQTCIDYIHRGKLGDITYLQGMWHWNYGVSGRYLDLDQSGGWFLAQACHHVDVMQWVMQDRPPIRCTAIGSITQDASQAPNPCSEDHSAISFEYPGHVIFSYTHVMNSPEAFNGEKLWVYAKKGGLDLRLGKMYPFPKGETKQVAPGSVDWDEGTYDELEHFAKHIKNNQKPLSNVETGRLSTLAGIMGRHAMYNRKADVFEPSVVNWNDLIESI